MASVRVRNRSRLRLLSSRVRIRAVALTCVGLRLELGIKLVVDFRVLLREKLG